MAKGKWTPSPLLKQVDFEQQLVCHGTLHTLERLLQILGRVNTFIPYTSPLWLEISRQIKIRDHWRCRSCGGCRTLDVHHIVPIKHGGSNLPSNLKTLCRKCHRVRHPEVRKAKYVS